MVMPVHTKVRERIIKVEEHYQLAAVARLLGVHRSTVARWLAEGRFGGHYVSAGRTTVLIPASGVNEFLASNRVEVSGG